MNLTLESSTDDIKRLSCAGVVNIDLTVEPVNPLEDLLGSKGYSNKVMLNMEKTTSISSTGVAWLVKSHRLFEQSGGRLVIHSLPPMVHNVLKLLNMPKLLYLAEDTYEAQALIDNQ